MQHPEIVGREVETDIDTVYAKCLYDLSRDIAIVGRLHDVVVGRHRIEHASVLNEHLISRMKKANVIASVQPHFIVSDFWVADRVGVKRARWVYPFGSLVNGGIMVTGGSDFPVEPMNPLLGIWAAVAKGAFPEERLKVGEALQLYTSSAAFASFEENAKGSIERGKLADLVILSRDPHEVSP